MSECRAKNPRACRVHGNAIIVSLQDRADKAAASGNIEEYMALREKLDAAHEVADSQAAPPLAESKLDTKAIEGGAKGWFKATTEYQRWEDQDAVTQEDIRNDTRDVLMAAEPHMQNGVVTREAIAAARSAIVSKILSRGHGRGFGDRNTDPSYTEPYLFNSIAESVVYGAAPHLREATE